MDCLRARKEEGLHGFAYEGANDRGRSIASQSVLHSLAKRPVMFQRLRHPVQDVQSFFCKLNL